MLIVGGTAAVIAIAIYLGWHYLDRWRVSVRRRKAEARIAAADAGRDAEEVRETRELHLAR